MKNKTYLLIYMKETDGETFIESLTANEIKEKVKSLDYNDYAIIDGEILKSFNSKSFDLKKL